MDSTRNTEFKRNSAFTHALKVEKLPVLGPPSHVTAEVARVVAG